MDVQEIQAAVLNILAFVHVLLLITLRPPLDDCTFPLRQRLYFRIFADVRVMVVTYVP